MIKDAIAFIPHRYSIDIKDGNRDIAEIVISLNFSVAMYYELLTYTEMINSDETELSDKREYLYTLFYDLLMLDPEAQGKISAEWIINNIPVPVMLNVINQVEEQLIEMLKENCFVIPEIDVVKKEPQGKQTDAEEERRRKRHEIERMNKQLSVTGVTLTDEIAMMLMNTSCSYNDIMDMPILMFRALLRSIYLGIIRKDDDYNYAYLKKETQFYKDEIAIGIPAEKADVKAIEDFFERVNNPS